MLAEAAPRLKDALKSNRVIIVTDKTVAEHHLPKLQRVLEDAAISYESIILPAGEPTKSFAHLETLVDSIIAHRPDRNTPLIAFGGGVIGDITGFAASIVLRGIPFIQIPTTLLAQVDSSVGGKTGINTRHGKNLAGSFYQPQLVLIDTDTLKTLPLRQLQAGYAEVVKYGVINDEPFLTWLEANIETLLKTGDEKILCHIIRKSCEAKAAIVAADEKEKNIRALLNLGHTFGHALEAETGFSDTLLHGEAVAIGMVMAMYFSAFLGLCPKEDAERVHEHLDISGLPTHPFHIRKEWDIDAIVQHFYHDKKVQDGKLTFVLAKGIGKAFVSQDITEAQVREFLHSVFTDQ